MIGRLLCFLGLHPAYLKNQAGGRMCPRCKRGTTNDPADYRMRREP